MLRSDEDAGLSGVNDNREMSLASLISRRSFLVEREFRAELGADLRAEFVGRLDVDSGESVAES